MVHSTTSIECSKEADAKGLHGKERKKFVPSVKEQAQKLNSARPDAVDAIVALTLVIA